MAVRILISLLLVFSLAHAHAQRISFCERVDEKGNAINASNTFAISKTGGSLNFLVNLPNEFGHAFAVYDIFMLDSLGKEKFDNTVKQAVQPSVMIFSKQIDFYRPGKYRVYVYNDYDKFLCGGELTVVMK